MASRRLKRWWLLVAMGCVAALGVTAYVAHGAHSSTASVTSDGVDSRTAEVVVFVLRPGAAGETMPRLVSHYGDFPGVASSAGGRTTGRLNLGADATMAQLAALRSALGGEPAVARVREYPPASAPPLDVPTKGAAQVAP